MKSLHGLLSLVLAVLVGALQPESVGREFQFIKSSGGIREYRLKDNGLTVLLMEDHSAPVVTFMVTYRVGSRNEAVGHTGSTHLLEHLMFKGSENFNKERGNPIWVVLQNVGAMINASTWMDRTNYFELLPSEHLEEAMGIESDRMRKALLRDEDRQPEMTVVRNEFERGENDPFEALDKNIWATAYQAHPYHHSTIGWRSDIENVSTERLRQFYNTFYWPNNATVTIIGDFDRQAALKMVYAYFGSLPRSPQAIPEVYTTEPEQQGPRRVIVKRAGQAGIVGIAHKSPPGLHEDTYPLQVLSKILGSGKTSRLYKSIVDKGLATRIFMWDFPFHDNALFITYAFLTPATDHQQVEEIILEEYDRVKSSGVTDEEVKRAQAKIRAETAFSRDGSYSIASSLNEAIALGDWTFYTTFLTNIERVTAEDVQAVAKKYLQEDHSTTGWFVPKSVSGGESGGIGSSGFGGNLFWRAIADEEGGIGYGFSSPQPIGPSGSSAVSSIAERIVDEYVLDGVRVISLQTDIEDVVTMQGSLLGGDVFSPDDNSVVAEMTARMLDQGTTLRDKFTISEALEEVGASLSFYAANYRVRFTARCLSKDVPLVIELLAEQLRYPAFNAEDLATAKKRRVGDLKRSKERTRTRALEAFLQDIYPEDHPNYYIPIDKQIEDTERLTVEDLKRFHDESYGVGSLTIVAVGDVDRRDLEDAIAKGFEGWKPSPLSTDMVGGSKAKPRRGAHSSAVTMADKTSVHLMIGQPIGIDRNHEDYLPLMVGHYILGGNFSARLMSTVRDEEGLTYGIRSRVDGVDDGNDGYWYVLGTFAPTLLDKGKESTLTQLEKWISEGVSAEELAAKKTTITGSYRVSLATTRGLARTILINVERAKEMSYIDEYPAEINAITLDEVNNAIRKYCDTKTLITVAAGSIDEKGRPLKE